jgi:hypothetical protein
MGTISNVPRIALDCNKQCANRCVVSTFSQTMPHNKSLDYLIVFMRGVSDIARNARMDLDSGCDWNLELQIMHMEYLLDGYVTGSRPLSKWDPENGVNMQMTYGLVHTALRLTLADFSNPDYKEKEVIELVEQLDSLLSTLTSYFSMGSNREYLRSCVINRARAMMIEIPDDWNGCTAEWVDE